jgi:hypothetical protein
MDPVVTVSNVITRKIRLSEESPSGAEIYPAQPARTKNQLPQDKVIIKDRKIYETRGIVMHDTVKVTHEGIFRGRRLANVAVYLHSTILQENMSTLLHP